MSMSEYDSYGMRSKDYDLGYQRGYADAKKEIEYATKTNPVIERYGVELKEEIAYECGKPKWIPCSERLPDKNHAQYLVTVQTSSGGLFTSRSYFFNKEVGWSDKCIVAWMPMPEPYKEEGE